MTDETKAKLLDLSGNQAVADAIDAHVRAVVEEMLHPEDGQYPPSCLDASCVGADAEANRILLSRVSGALVDAGTVEVEPYDAAIRRMTSERDRLAARVAELEMNVELADAHEGGYRSRITDLETKLLGARTLPNKWPQPTFMNTDDGGALNIEWCFADHRVLFVWDPVEGAMAYRSGRRTADEQTSVDGSDAARALDTYLTTEANVADTCARCGANMSEPATGLTACRNMKCPDYAGITQAEEPSTGPAMNEEEKA